MDLSLKDVTDIMSVIKTIDRYSIILWLSLTVPLYYIAFKKLLPEHKPVEHQSFTQKLSHIFTLPKVEGSVMLFSLFLFIVGSFLVVYGQQQKETLRNNGWILKNQMVNTGYYSMVFSDITQSSRLGPEEIRTLVKQFPREFSIVYGARGNGRHGQNETLILSDSLTKERLVCRSVQILASYLNNDAVLHDNGIISFDTLFEQNHLFTYAIDYRLIADSGYRFAFNLNAAGDTSKGFGIERMPRR